LAENQNMLLIHPFIPINSTSKQTADELESIALSRHAVFLEFINFVCYHCKGRNNFEKMQIKKKHKEWYKIMEGGERSYVW
jgi:hypothetical protein